MADIKDDNKVAIVGIGCRFAGNADSPEALWEILKDGRDCTREIPSDRYDVSYHVSPGEKRPGKMYNSRGGYLSNDLYQFDRQFFKMSPGNVFHISSLAGLNLAIQCRPKITYPRGEKGLPEIVKYITVDTVFIIHIQIDNNTSRAHFIVHYQLLLTIHECTVIDQTRNF